MLPEFAISPKDSEELLLLLVEVEVEVEVEGVFQRLERSVYAVLELVSGVFEGCIHHARSEPPVEELDVVVTGAGSGSAAGVEGASHH